MPNYAGPVADLQFVLHEMLRISEQKIPGYDALDRETTGAVLEEAARFSSEILAPLNASGDREGARLDNGVVRTPAGFRQAFDMLRAGGWTGLDCDPDYGGQGMPHVLQVATGEMFSAANQAFYMYPGLTHGACSAIHAHGSAEQKALYLPKLVSCDWTGTMNLTEPQCGTDLGLMRTRAEPQPDGSYRITGQKIFISAGDHDLAENIIHLVLAKIPGGPDGTRGISLFIVPKILVEADGKLGARNAVTVGKLETKMGIHANATCVMDYDGATGFLLGAPHKGMRAMFTMMNEARLGVAMQGLSQASAAYQNAVTYARDRLQGRSPGRKAAETGTGAADPIITHPDVRRMLMDQKSFIEGARALCLWGGTLIDAARLNGDGEAEALISLLTPVLKGFITDQGFEAAIQAQQIFGGHGYVEDQGMSQFARDARITMIYEGANGIQALDLVGRKLAADSGKAIMAYFTMMKAFCSEAAATDETIARDFVAPLKNASEQLQQAAMFFMEKGLKDPAEALAGAYDFMHLFGHVAMGHIWTRMALAAMAARNEDRLSRDACEAKLATGRYYMARRLPACTLHLARITSGASPVMDLPAGSF